MIDDFLDFLRFIEFMDFIKSLDDYLTKVTTSQGSITDDFKELPSLTNLNLKYKTKPVSLYLINEKDGYNPNLIYVSQKDYLSLQNLMHKKIDNGTRLCEKTCSDNHPTYLRVNKESCALFYCNNLEQLITNIKSTNVFKKKNHNPKEINHSYSEKLPSKRVKKQELINNESALVTELVFNNKRADDLMIGYLDNVIDLLSNYCKPTDVGEIHLKARGSRGHHFPSVILRSLYEVSKVAPIEFISTSRGEWLRDLSFNIKDNKSVSELVSELDTYKKSIESKYSD